MPRIAAAILLYLACSVAQPWTPLALAANDASATQTPLQEGSAAGRVFSGEPATGMPATGLPATGSPAAGSPAADHTQQDALAKLGLTAQEKAWLAQHPTLRLGTDPSWPPFEFTGANNSYLGLSAEYVRLIEQRLNIKLEHVEPGNWSAVLEQAKNAKIDLLPGVMATPDRIKTLAFTRPYLDFPIVILAREDGPHPDSIRALYGLKVAVVKNYAPDELLRQQHPDLNLLQVPSVNAGLQALATGRADVLISDIASSTWSLHQQKIDNLIISGETPYRYQLAMAVPKQNAIFVEILDKLFASLTPGEQIALQEPWVGGKLQYNNTWQTLLDYGLPALLILLAILALTLMINRRMSGEIARRTTLEHELRCSEAHYRRLVENLSAVTWEAAIGETAYRYVSPHAEKLLGYSLEQWRQADFWPLKLHPQDHQQTTQTRRAETAAGRDHTLEYRMIAADGQTVWIREIVTIDNAQEQPTLRGLMIDISEAKHIEQAKRTSELKFSLVFQNCPDVMIISQREDGRIIDANYAFEQQTGISRSEALGKTATEMNLWSLPNTGPELIRRLNNGESLSNIEMPFQLRNGNKLTGLLSVQAFQLDEVPVLIAIVRDITQLKRTQKQLQTSEEKFAKAFHASPDGMLITRLEDGLLIDANLGFEQITGYNREVLSHKTTVELGLWAKPTDRDKLIEQIKTVGSVRRQTSRIRHRNGNLCICEISAQMIQIGEQSCLLSIIRDITERESMQAKLQLAATVFESTIEGVVITDTQQRITAINHAFSEITGYSEAQALGQTPRILASGQHDREFFSEMWQRLNIHGHWQGEVWNRRLNNESFPAWLTINEVRDNESNLSHYVGVIADITPLKQAQARLDYQAHHDPLTGLPNRLLFETRLSAALRDAQADNQNGAVLFLDLDRFKHINDSLGHPVGDQLLVVIAERLKEQLRDLDTVSRLGGDEFIILLPGLNNSHDAETIANKLLACFTEPFNIHDHTFYISASIGISLYPVDGEDVATIVKNADAAMYQSKAKGRNRVERYTVDLTSKSSARINLETDLRQALERNELVLHYQPKLDLASQSIIGAEALVRWNHPEYGTMLPDRFIPLAEDTGLILPLGEWVLNEACRQLHEWRQTHAEFGPLSVNLSSLQLHQPHLTETISTLLERYQLPANLLQLEITETFIMNRTEGALRALHKLKKLGLQLAIDDFGTGYSSLSYLKQLPLDVLKIDKSFVSGLPADLSDAAISRAIITLGRNLNLTVVAEGVETEAQVQFLTSEGCEQIQGYIVSPALTAGQFADKFLHPRSTLGTTGKAPV
uniref:cyclic-guanylate-specific phosphodiesterase n=1 Tax=Pseudomonas marincola TaxID=437900 RepID=A0A653E3U6_9PSED